MEMQVGMIAHTNCYKEGFDIGNEEVTLEKFAAEFN